MLNQDSEDEMWSRFVFELDLTSKSYFGKMNWTLGSVVPLAMFLFFLWKQYTTTLASLEYLCWKTFGVFVLKNFLFSQQKSRLFFDNHQPCPLLPIRHFHRKALSRSSFSAREQFSMQFIIGFWTTLFVGYIRKRKTVICLKNVGRNYVALTCSILDCMDHHPLALKTQYSGCF